MTAEHRGLFYLKWSQMDFSHTTAVAAKCLVACLFLELSQQPTWPQLIHSRRYIHVSPSSRHSLQTLPLGVATSIWSRCVQTTTFGLLGVCHTLLDHWCPRCVGVWPARQPAHAVTPRA